MYYIRFILLCYASLYFYYLYDSFDFLADIDDDVGSFFRQGGAGRNSIGEGIIANGNKNCNDGDDDDEYIFL